MRSPAGWSEPGQTPEFDEYSIVLNGTLHVAHKTGALEVRAGQAVIAHRGEWVRISRRKARNTFPCVYRRFLQLPCIATEHFFIGCVSQSHRILFPKATFSNILISLGVHKQGGRLHNCRGIDSFRKYASP